MQYLHVKMKKPFFRITEGKLLNYVFFKFVILKNKGLTNQAGTCSGKQFCDMLHH